MIAVYCTAPSDISIRQLEKSAQSNIPDPRDVYSYQTGDARLDFLSSVVPVELVNEDWPFTYDGLMETPIVKSEPQNCQPSFIPLRPHQQQ